VQWPFAATGTRTQRPFFQPVQIPLLQPIQVSLFQVPLLQPIQVSLFKSIQVSLFQPIQVRGTYSISILLTLTISLDGVLPAPNPGLTIKFVTIGRGTQNYTCDGPNSQPVFVGALATIYNASSFALSDLNEAITCALYDPNSLSLSDQQILGNHFFNAGGTPIFNLDAVGDILIGKKIASVAAPTGADPGPGGTGAVPWVTLVDAGGSVGLKEIYRVETAGGNPPANCASAGLVVEPYAALYLFFG
jgi:hypothetical protein